MEITHIQAEGLHSVHILGKMIFCESFCVKDFLKPALELVPEGSLFRLANPKNRELRRI